MPAPAHLAFVWHQHQPYYPDDVARENPMPWVRLHATKDYLGMALHIKEVPEFRCAINLVPSLLVQINQYVEGRTDRHLDVSKMPADGLGAGDAAYLMDNFFMANAETMVRPHARYSELLDLRGFGSSSADEAARRFSEKDVRDLQIWSNLAWVHELVFERDADLREFREKGRHWTESEKDWFLDRQRELVGEVIPSHKELSEGGQVDLTTTPMYHPILPLLWNKESAREAMPGCPLPGYTQRYEEDAIEQIRRGVEYHTEQFGAPPAGMWPSEGSVSQAILSSIAETGVPWIATDEEILAHSTGGLVSRDGRGHLKNPDKLFRPWDLNAQLPDGSPLRAVFREHALSDGVGFHYQRMDPHHAANDLLGKIDGIRRAVGQADGGRPALVPVVLDGENCWEYYPDGGVGFLRTLYRECVSRPDVRPVRISDHIAEHPPTDRVDRLFAGSWINHDFYIWIGHKEDRDGWDRLHETRAFLVEEEANGADPGAVKKAWREIYIAEGSDWFWWYGDDRTSGQDDVFDDLFRRHLRNVYKLLGADPPANLDVPITDAEPKQVHSQPTGFVSVTPDGRKTYFEWISAGRYEPGNDRGTMAIVTEGLIKEASFGFDLTPDELQTGGGNFCLRLDAADRAAEALAGLDAVRVRFQQPEGVEIRVPGLGPDSDGPTPAVFRDGEPVDGASPRAGLGDIFELVVPLADLGVEPGDPVHFSVEVVKGDASEDRAPREGSIRLQCPTADFERERWQA